MANSTLLTAALLALAVSIAAVDWEASCKESDHWKDGCYTCSCVDACKENDQWKDDCRSCRCTNGLPVCTKQLCPGDAAKVTAEPPNQPSSAEEPSCEPGHKWVEDCNNCICDNDGQPECTRRLCAP